MASETIFDLTQETAMTAAARLVLQETSAATRATSATFALLGGLEHATGADSDTSMEVGKLYVTDMSAWATADRTYTLPANAQVGERIGIMVSAGDASHELIITAAASDTLNGVAGGTEWSRLFITGEVVIMRCVTANSAWIVEYDGRIPCLAIYEDSTGQSVATATDYPMDLSAMTEEINRGDCALTASNYFVARREMLLEGVSGVYWSGKIDDNAFGMAKVQDYKSAAWNDPQGLSATESSQVAELQGYSNTRTMHLAVDERARAVVKHSDSTDPLTSIVMNCSFKEVLNT